ncbi:glycosyltransferase family 2 protein [Oenococcus oeni]|uniref:glycosyltransferase family 2 protein n=2 Tax=Oenococcus oeni TaxID=1247 RepID=UPI0008F9217C|nr:glycosyltransferase [Oenococcus oeni]MDV7687525.1 glycosyltransferase [Oenococcus oeni]OIM23703.1 glycosyl transferase [Oenococcus oeni]OIM54999.1 glycosyl transferase [Oenococcus oeni]SYW08274.1 Glycosyl transferase [Oenococcus oeni]
MVSLIINLLFFILISYPIIGAMCWFCGVLCYQFLYKSNSKRVPHRSISKNKNNAYPFISIIVPAHNEEVLIENTIDYLMNEIDYPNYEVIVADDGSTDNTPSVLKKMSEKYIAKNFRTLRVNSNKGKAHALNIAAGFAKGEFILSNDADVLPESNALNRYMDYFFSRENSRVAAVTGNMSVRNRSSILGKSQTVEFSSIVGSIKRSQSATIDTMYAYSGANTMYRKSALIDVGMFRQDRATEDISIAWDHSLNGWETLFAPDIMFYMNVPENLISLFHQRKRWAKGGIEVWLSNFIKVVKSPIKYFKQVILLLDQTCSIVWSFSFFILFFFFCINMILFFINRNYVDIETTLLYTSIFIVFELFSGLIEVGVSLIFDDASKKTKYIIFTPLYLLIFWIINPLAIVVSLPGAIKTVLGNGIGTWASPKRN